MNNLETFFNDISGNWVSERTYYYLKLQSYKRIKSFIKREYLESNNELLEECKKTVTDIDFGYFIDFCSFNDKDEKENSGKFIFGIKDNIIYRSRGYFTEEPTKSILTIVEKRNIKTNTSYNNSLFVESIEIIDLNKEVNNISRQTIASKNKNVYLIGQYYEYRI